MIVFCAEVEYSYESRVGGRWLAKTKVVVVCKDTSGVMDAVNEFFDDSPVYKASGAKTKKIIKTTHLWDQP